MLSGQEPAKASPRHNPRFSELTPNSRPHHGRCVVAVYPSQSAAKQARKELLRQGISEHNLKMSGRGTGAAEGEEDGGGFFDWLFGSDVRDEDCNFYETHLTGERTALSVYLRSDDHRTGQELRRVKRIDSLRPKPEVFLMSLDQWLIFLPAAFALNIFPGPNNLLSLSNGARFGLSAAFWAGFGRLPAFAVMVALTALGLGALLATSETAFLVLKWAGALYLLYLGIGMMRASVPYPEQQHTQAGQRLSLKALLRQEFFVAASNPKAIAIFTAFLPQFIQPGEAVWSQLALMGAAFIVMEIAAMAIYAAGGWRLRGLARSRTGLKWINRSSGAALIVAAFALMLSRRAPAPG